MKKFRRIAYIILILVIIILSLAVYTNAGKDNDHNEKDKAFTEIKFLESKFKNLLNTMNNIETRNYKVYYGEISEVGKQESNSESGGSSSKSSEGGSGGNNSSSESSSSSGSSESNNNQQEKGVKFDLKRNGALNNSENINWDEVKGEVETLYTSIPNITLDLYRINLNHEDILSFNKEFDNLTVAAKNESKEDALTQLSTLYDYIPKFTQNATDDEVYKKTVETKSHIFKAYSKLDNDNWNEMSNDVNNAINTYSQLLTNTNIDSTKQYSINKVYVMLNELQNAVSIKDKSVFLVKYKNLVEEISNI